MIIGCGGGIDREYRARNLVKRSRARDAIVDAYLVGFREDQRESGQRAPSRVQIPGRSILQVSCKLIKSEISTIKN